MATQTWWKECRSQQGWRLGAPHREAAPLHFVVGAHAPWYLESCFNADSSRGIWAVYLSPLCGNGAHSVGTGQGGAVSSLFDLATGHVASSYLGNPSPTANLHVDMLKPARSIPGCFKLEAWVESLDGKKCLMKATLSNGETGVVYDTAESLIIDVGGKRGRVSDDLKNSKLVNTTPIPEPTAGDTSHGGVKRHEAGLAVMQRMGQGDAGSLGNADPERAARFMQRSMGALGSFNTDIVLGTVWTRTQLDRRSRSLIVISALMTQRTERELDYHLRVALNHGVTRGEIDEVVIQVAGYGGFPSAMPASRAVDAVFRDLDGLGPDDRLPEREAAPVRSDEERGELAADVRHKLTAGRVNPDPALDRVAMVEALGGVGEIAYDFAFGEIWSRPQLSRRDRSLIVLSILGTLARDDEIEFHTQGALNHGLSREEIEEVFVQLTIYAGIPKAVGGVQAAKTVG